MREAPFSPGIQPFKKPIEIGVTNNIYYDPKSPDVLIRIPKDEEVKFLETDPKLIRVSERIYDQLKIMGEPLDIDIAPHQFILAKEASDGPVKPMLLAKRIEGTPFFPVDTEDPRTLESISRITKLGLGYLNWIESKQLRAIVTDIFRPEQYITQKEKIHDRLTLVDIESRLKDREYGKQFINHELAMLVAPLRGTEYNDVFNQFMHHAFKSLKQNSKDPGIASLINVIVNAHEVYRQMSDDFLSGREPQDISDELKKQLRNKQLIINAELLKKFGIDKI
jgi:hypothetical protein